MILEKYAETPIDFRSLSLTGWVVLTHTGHTFVSDRDEKGREEKRGKRRVRPILRGGEPRVQEGPRRPRVNDGING